MPHGDLSDSAASFCALTGLVSLFYPQSWFLGLGPVQPMLDGDATPAMLSLIQVIGGLLLLLGPVFFVVRWNTLNGKAAMLGCLIASATFAAVGLRLDSWTFVPRGWYLFTSAFFVSGMHFGFNANPMLTSAMLLEKEKAKAAKKA
ncbi:hypothetical protein TrCOL_g704 [Triparma columacea]|uniref:Uncharacterized protein n=1 Tax=Triparma columacea TaxID=722753 RepID=A0A9W7GKH9_9STRA|nr:hypothetical protein TrCOL_g704 [Triparma columacea]